MSGTSRRGRSKTGAPASSPGADRAAAGPDDLLHDLGPEEPLEDLDEPAAESANPQDRGIEELARELRRRLEHCQHHHHHHGPDHDEPPLSLDTISELLVLLTGVRTIWDTKRSELPAPSRIDEYIEDMIDPEFGYRPARTVIVQAAERILHGYDALRFPRRRRRPGVLTDLDED